MIFYFLIALCGWQSVFFVDLCELHFEMIVLYECYEVVVVLLQCRQYASVKVLLIEDSNRRSTNETKFRESWMQSGGTFTMRCIGPKIVA